MDKEKAVDLVVETIVDKGENVLYITLDNSSDRARKQIIERYIERETYGRITPDSIARKTLTEEGKATVKELTEEFKHASNHGMLVVSDVKLEAGLTNLLFEVAQFDNYPTVVIDTQDQFGEGSKERNMLKDTAKELMKRKPPIKLYSIL